MQESNRQWLWQLHSNQGGLFLIAYVSWDNHKSPEQVDELFFVFEVVKERLIKNISFQRLTVNLPRS
jgi:hypothetical protein